MNLLKALSVLLYPTVVAVPLVIVFGFPSLFNILVGFALISLIPTVSVVIYAKTKGTDWDITEQNKRRIPFILAMISYMIAVGVFWYTGSKIMLAMSSAYLVVTFSLFIVNFKTKISVHCAGMGGTLADVLCVFGWIALPLFLLVPFVAYTRVKMRAHTIRQTIYGSLLSIFISYPVFYVIFYIS
ncbi:MAG: hypothetical protein ABIA21_02560 [Candidatus Aenigmatarchaeota archaeon]